MARVVRRHILAGLGIAALVLFLTGEPLSAQSSAPLFYYYEGGRVPLTLNPGQILVGFKPGVSDSTRMAVADSTGDIRSYDEGLDERPLSVSLLPMNPGRDPLVAIQRFKQHPEVQTAGRVFRFDDGGQFAETDEFVARFKTGITTDVIARFNSANRVQLVREQEFSDHVMILQPAPGNPQSALDLANAYFQSGLVDFAEPNFVIVQPALRETLPAPSTVTQVNPNDTGFSLQWPLKNTQQFQGSVEGADINATSAWGVTTGATQIKIAIIDEGVDSTNQDLQGKVLPGINVTVNPNNSDTSPNAGDKHGTAVASIAAANSNNALGITGVCWACKILPVKVAFEDSSGNWVTTTSRLAAGIDWAWSNGADVLSNSWTMSAASDDVKFAIVNARFGGRGGRGSALVFAAGNNNSSTISFPANLNKYVIAVGASNWCDRRKTPTNDDCNDHETNWGSNYGGVLDLVAPGQIVLASCNGANCYEYFSGTSASTPLVAGAAALLYSLNPNLQPQDVQNALQLGAKDLPPSGKDAQSGYGRLDAYRAMAALYDVGITIVDNNSLVHPGDAVQYTLTYSNSGLTVMGGTVLQVALPPGLTYLNSNPAFTPLGGGVYQLNAGSLPRFVSRTATLTAQVQPGTEGQALTAVAQIAGAFPELDTSDNTASDTVGVAKTNIFLPFIIY